MNKQKELRLWQLRWIHKNAPPGALERLGEALVSGDSLTSRQGLWAGFTAGSSMLLGVAFQCVPKGIFLRYESIVGQRHTIELEVPGGWLPCEDLAQRIYPGDLAGTASPGGQRATKLLEEIISVMAEFA